MESHFKPQQYKLVSDPTSGNEWVKELNNPGTDSRDSTRHHIQTGPQGGKYFINNADNHVYASTIRNTTQVYAKDTQ